MILIDGDLSANIDNSYFGGTVTFEDKSGSKVVVPLTLIRSIYMIV